MRFGFYFVVMLLGFQKVHIGGAFGHDYKVVLTETGFEDARESGVYASGEDLIGEFFPYKREIYVRPTGDIKEMQRVVAHEILIHGCYFESKMHDGLHRDEDEVANNIDKCIAETLHDNPALIRFLQQ